MSSGGGRASGRRTAGRRLVVGRHDAADEHAADRAATRTLRGEPVSVPRGATRTTAGDHVPAPPSVAAALSRPGRTLDAGSRSEAENRYGSSLAAVRVHTGADAARSARDVDAFAYTVGQDVVLGADAPAPTTPRGRHLLAHELAHVVQGGPVDVVRRYRRSTAMAFGELDTATLVEQSFDARTDKETKPWISLVTVELTGTTTDDDGSTYWTGTATATYYANGSRLADVVFGVAGGSAELGRSDPGTFTVSRIEGYGYNSGSYSGTVDPATRESGANWKYTRKDPLTGGRAANMSLAVFYNGGEALHVGPLDFSSHGCVHVGWAAMRQVNYHSVVGLTKVKVRYPARP